MYYLSELPKCRCGKVAAVELKTSGTVSYGYFCKSCGRKEVKERNAAKFNTTKGD